MNMLNSLRKGKVSMSELLREKINIGEKRLKGDRI